MDHDLEHRWAPLLERLSELPELLPELARRYAEPHRAYHGIEHIAALAQLYVDVARGPSWHAPTEVALAILFHDAIYEPGRPDNEDRSAELAIELLHDKAQRIDVPRIAMMIRATKTHDQLGQLGQADDHDLAHFIDADMAIIGTAAHVYDAYAQAVRREFSSIPAPMFERGRQAFLLEQLARPSLFHTAWFRTRYEDAARRNLARELATLTSHG
jgi:predicted metal-dependent HD superfamily phosphohydrolase